MSTPIARSLVSLTIAEVLFNLSGYVIHAVAGRVLGPAEYGRYGLVITLTTTVIILIGNGIPTAMSRYLSEYFEKTPGMIPIIKRTGIRLQFLLISGVTFLFFLLAPIIARLLSDPSLAPLFRLSSLIIPAFAASSFYFYYFTGVHLFAYQAILKMTRSILRIALIVPLIILYKTSGAIIGYILVPLFTFLLGVFFDRKTAAPFTLSDSDNTSPSFPWRSLLAYAWPITLFLLFYEIFISIDLYLVKILLKNDTQTGLYNAALTLARLPSYLFYALSIVILPALAKLKSDGEPERVSHLMGQALRYAGIILLPLFIILFAYAEPILTLFFGNAYTDAIALFRILVFGLSFLTVFYTVAMGMIGLGHARLVMWLALFGTLMNAVLVTILTAPLQTAGAAWATTVSTTFITLLTLILIQPHVRTPIRITPIAQTLATGGLLFLGTILFPASSSLFLLPATLLGLAYCGILFILGILTQEDIRPLLELFSKQKKKADR